MHASSASKIWYSLKKDQGKSVVFKANFFLLILQKNKDWTLGYVHMHEFSMGIVIGYVC
jgi:hypothetical protein